MFRNIFSSANIQKQEPYDEIRREKITSPGPICSNQNSRILEYCKIVKGTGDEFGP